jgi:hypothetical protein
MTYCEQNVVQPDTPQMTIWRMRIACWIPKATNTHSEYVIFIAFLTETVGYVYTCIVCRELLVSRRFMVLEGREYGEIQHTKSVLCYKF